MDLKERVEKAKSEFTEAHRKWLEENDEILMKPARSDQERPVVEKGAHERVRGMEEKMVVTNTRMCKLEAFQRGGDLLAVRHRLELRYRHDEELYSLMQRTWDATEL